MSIAKKEEQIALINELTEKYQTVIGGNFQKRENELIQQLFEKAKILKQELAFFKKEASQQNIEKMIAERRREKQKERQVLEGHWRECSQSFKYMHQEQKRLTNEQKQSAFDIQNLQNKIQDFQTQIEQRKKRIESLEDLGYEFVTEAKENYHSPYKAAASMPRLQLQRLEKEQRLLEMTQQHFFTNKYSLSQGQGCLWKEKSQNHFRNITSQENDCKIVRPIACQKKKIAFNLNNRGFKKKDTTAECYQNLSSFLSNKEVKTKIFKVLKKQL